MDRIFTQAAVIIARYGGTVEKFIGDAVVALFGMRVSHEDDTLCAIQAAYEIHRFVEGLAFPGDATRAFSMHTGIHSGGILAGESGGTAATGALGMPINIAARLSALAGPGEIIIGEAASAEAERHFELQALGERTLKGVREPVRIFKVLSQRAIPRGVHRSAGIVSVFVGRQRPLAMLEKLVRDLDRGRASLAWVTGEAGVGKSRLVQEFHARLPGHIRWYEAHCREFARHLPYYPIRALLGQWGPGAQKTLAYLEERDPEKHAGAGKNRPAEYRMRLYERLSTVLASMTAPMIICIEDCQWADRSSIDFLRYCFAPQPAIRPCLIILCSRETVPFGPPGHTIHLRELSPAEVKAMLSGMLPIEIAEQRHARIYRETGGNPFYIEELVNYLYEDGGDASRPPGVPPTLKGLLAARLDRLDHDSRHILQLAAVIGAHFSLSLLGELDPRANEDRMAGLADSGFILPLRPGTYAFRHAITCEAVYATILKHARIDAHRRVGVSLEQRAPRASPALLAHHFCCGRVYDKAFRYSLLAAQHAQSSGSWVEAVSHYRAAEAALRELPADDGREESLRTIWEGIWGCSRIFHPDQAIAALRELVQAYQTQGLGREAVFAKIRLINLYAQKAQFGAAQDTYRETLALTEDDGQMRAAAQTTIAYAYTLRGRPEEALHLLEAARPAFGPEDLFLVAVNALTTLTALVWRGHIADGRTWYAQARSYCRGHRDLELLCDLWLGYLEFLAGNFARARSLFAAVSQAEQMLGAMAGTLTYIRTQSAIYFNTHYLGQTDCAREDLDTFRRSCETMQVQGAGALLDLYTGWIELAEGRFETARTHLEAALPILEDGIANRVPYAVNALAEAQLGLQELEAARATALRGIAWNKTYGNQDQLIWSLRVLGESCIAMDALPEARTALGEAGRLSWRLQMAPHAAWISASWARYRGRMGFGAKMRSWRQRAAALWRRMGNPYQARQLEADQVR